MAGELSQKPALSTVAVSHSSTKVPWKHTVSESSVSAHSALSKRIHSIKAPVINNTSMVCNVIYASIVSGQRQNFYFVGMCTVLYSLFLKQESFYESTGKYQ